MNFRALLAGSGCNAFGFFGEQVVVGFGVYALTASSFWVGASLALYFAPMFFFGLASGAIADWTSDRRVLIRRTELALAASAAGFSLGIAVLSPSVAALLALSVVTGVGLAMHQTLRGAIAFDLSGAERIVRRLGWLNLAARIGQLAGAAAAGWVTRESGAAGGLVLIAAVHLCGAGAYGWFRGLSRRVRAGPGLRGQFAELVAELRANHALAWLVALTAGVEILGFSFVTALPELARQRFGLGAEGLGALHAARAAGAIAAAACLASVSRLRGGWVPYLLIVGVFAVALVGLANAEHLLFALVALAGIAALAVGTDVLSQSMMQLAVSDRLRGRAMGAWVFAIGAAPLGHLELGWAINRFGLQTALSIHGLLLGALALGGGFAVGRLPLPASPGLQGPVARVDNDCGSE